MKFIFLTFLLLAKSALGGNVDSLPLVSQVKSLVQVIGGDEEGARRTQEEFSRGCPVVSQVRSAVEAASGDMEAARKTQEYFGRELESVADGLPVVGHVKGAVHYACGDMGRGEQCMKSASRSVAVIGGGIIGGPGAAVFAGMAFDGVATGIETAVKGEYCPNGSILNTIDKGIKGENIAGDVFDTGFDIVSDAMTGNAMQKAKVQSGEVVSKKPARQEYVQQKNAIKNELPKSVSEQKKSQIVRDIREAAEAIKAEEIKGGGHVMTLCKDFKGNSGQGLSSRARSQKRVKKFTEEKEQVKAGTLDASELTYRTKKQAELQDPYCNGKAKSPLVEELPDAKHRKQHNGENVAHEKCAEHPAAYELKDKHGTKPKDTVSVMKADDGTIKTVERCGNCKQFSLGCVWTDFAPDLPVPNYAPSYVHNLVLGGAWTGGALYAGIIGTSKYNEKNALELLDELDYSNEVTSKKVPWGPEYSEFIESWTSKMMGATRDQKTIGVIEELRKYNEDRTLLWSSPSQVITSKVRQMRQFVLLDLLSKENTASRSVPWGSPSRYLIDWVKHMTATLGDCQDDLRAELNALDYQNKVVSPLELWRSPSNYISQAVAKMRNMVQ